MNKLKPVKPLFLTAEPQRTPGKPVEQTASYMLVEEERRSYNEGEIQIAYRQDTDKIQTY
jgi:hypothetical protein